LASLNGMAEEGDILWRQPVANSVEGTPAIDRLGNVYASGGSAVYSYATDGTHRWTTEVGDQAGEFNSPALSPDQKTVYGGGANFAYAIDAATGAVRWKNTDFEAGFHSVPAVSPGGGRIYLGAGAERDEGDSFYCIDTTRGTVLWEYVMKHEAQGFRGYLGGAIVAPDGTIYVSSQHGWLLSLTDNGKTYTENWAYNVGAEMRMPPAMDAAGYLYVGSSSAGGYIHKVNARTGKSAGGNWPVKTTAGEVFAHIAIAADGTVYLNAEDRRLWAFHPDGTVKWNNLEFEQWGSDPLIRGDGRIIVGAQLDDAARVACIRDEGTKATIEWLSDPIAKTLHLNETNVNIAPEGTLLITSGQDEFNVGESVELFAIEGNGLGLSTTSPWPKYMGNPQNNGHVWPVNKPAAKEGDILWQRLVSRSVESTPAVDSKGNVYAAGDTDVYAYTLDGTFRWRTEVGEGAWCEFHVPSLSPDEKVLYCGGVSYVFALDTETGAVIWKNSDFDVGFHSAPAVSKDGKRLYYGEGAEDDEGDSFWCIDASDGSVIWEYVMPYPARGYRGYIGGAIIASDGTLYIASQHGWLISLTDNGDSYTENWAYDNGAEMRMPPALDAEGFLYVGSSDGSGYVSKVDSRTGKSAGGNWPKFAWMEGGDAEHEIFANMVVAEDGTVYINSEDYQLWAVHPKGETKWTMRFEQWGSDPLIRADGRIIVAAELNGAARVACIRDDGDKGVVEWLSGPIAESLHTNETNVNIAPDGTIFITSGEHHPEEDLGPALLFAIQGNGQTLSTTAQWPTYMGDIQNTGNAPKTRY
jgi:outer membrane protein assembly factor BamB